MNFYGTRKKQGEALLGASLQFEAGVPGKLPGTSALSEEESVSTTWTSQIITNNESLLWEVYVEEVLVQNSRSREAGMFGALKTPHAEAPQLLLSPD